MRKRLFSIVAAGALIASAFTLAPAKAAPEVPADPNIVDPYGDANGHSSLTGQGGGLFVGAADYLAVWFTHDPENLYVHIHTTSPGFSAGSIWYSVYVDPGVGADCIEFRGLTEHQAVSARGELRLTGDCGDAIEDVELLTEEGPEVEGGTSGIHTITVPRSLSDHFADGKTLAIPNALSRYHVGTDDTGSIAGVGVLDNTEEGTEYTIGGGDPDPTAKPPGKKKGASKGNNKCAKIKNKKKKKACKKNRGKQKGKKNAPRACPAYQPGEQGAEAETLKVTDAATEEEPLVYEFSLDSDFSEGLSGETPEHFVNVQTDIKGQSTGLYVLFEFPTRRDYDLWAYWPSGNEAASAHGFNPLSEVRGTPVFDPSNTAGNHAGETTDHSEALVGVITPRCGGYTLGMYNYFGEGGDFELKIWLGEGAEEPKEDGGE